MARSTLSAVRRASRKFDPISAPKRWKKEVLQPLAEIALAANEETECLCRKLLLELVLHSGSPTMRRITAMAARTSRTSIYADDMVALAMWEVHRAVDRIDWLRWEEWQGLLACRLKNSPKIAARTADPLPRKERSARRLASTWGSESEQVKKRCLSAQETADLVAEARCQLGMRHQEALTFDPAVCLTIDLRPENYGVDLRGVSATSGEPDMLPEDQVIAGIEADIIREALLSDEPDEKLARWLMEASDHNRPPCNAIMRRSVRAGELLRLRLQSGDL